VIASLVRGVRQTWDAHSRKPFLQLVRLFGGRIFHGSNEGGGGELDLSLGLILSLLALPGGFYSILLFEKYATLLQWMRGQPDFDPLTAALPDEYFFIVLSMVVTGVVAVWRWDSIFPDRRDYANLVPLPILTRHIFLANLTAILFLTLVLALDVNAASAVLFPLVVSASENAFGFFLQFVWVHALVVILASVFSFFAVFVTVGALMVTLPYTAFRRVSLYLRGILLACLMTVLSTSFTVPAMVNQLPGTWVKFLPPVWFLGLCQLIRARASPSLAHLGWVAILGLGGVILAAIAAYALSYRRCFLRIPETTDVTPPSNRTRASWMARVLDRTILTSPYQRAGYRFVMKTLLRSEHHSLVLGGFFGFGVVIASQFLFAAVHGRHNELATTPSPEILAIPLILSYCIILGARFTFDIPTELRANWIFRLSLDKGRHECVPLARRVMLSLVLPWVVAVVLPVYGYLWGWRVALLQTVVVTTLSMLLTEVLLVRFRKIPFTCSYPPFRDSAVVTVLSYILGFFVFVVFTANLEYWSLFNPILMVAFVVIGLAVWYVLSQIHRGMEEIEKELIFEENATTGFELLDLQGGT